MEMDRRTALALLGGGVLSSRLEAAQRHAHTVRTKPQDYKLQFFSPDEHRLIDAVAEMILPADDHSPGAHEARIAYYIDLVVANSSHQTRSHWKSRLSAFDSLAREQHGQPFVALEAGRRAALLHLVGSNESHPSMPAEHFFVDMKKMTVFGYYTSAIGLLQELEYKGNAALASFPGCTHDPAVHK